MELVLPLLALLGHAFFWIGLVNRMHAFGISRRIVKLLTIVFFACALLIPIGIGRFCDIGPEGFATLPCKPVEAETLVLLVTAYVVLCWALAPITLLRLIWMRVFTPTPEIVRFHGRQPAAIDVASAAGGRRGHHWLTRLPLNEILRMEVTQWILDVPRLPPALDGLSIVHLSDTHFTGRIGKAYFHEAVRVSNELQPDLVCITGDIVDKSVCIDWIADTLGRLTARHGVYVVLGNHDRHVDYGRLRRALPESGLVDLGGRWRSVVINGAPVELGGHEGPWFDGLVDASARSSGAFHAPYGLRIVLAHTPDQFAWARRNDVDLLLAGHTHGGQIRIPPLGAILSPTWDGVKYISGVFYNPPTILHVTRGLSADLPIRWNCPPEIACLRLRAPIDS
jgi:uncharacterized protein